MGADMDEYRREALERAATCRAEAARTENLLLQRTWLRLAQQYEELAATAGEAEGEQQPKTCWR